MSYARWTDVPQAQKDELIDRVRVRYIAFDIDQKVVAVQYKMMLT